MLNERKATIMSKSTILKILSCVLVIILAVCVLASCGGTDGPNSDSPKMNEDAIDNLPDDLNYDGEQITFLYWGYDFLTWELTSDGSTGDIVEKAINKRNNTVQDRLNVKLNYIKGEIPAEVFSPTVRDEIMSGSKDYDLILAPQCTSGVVAAAGAFRDLQNAKYLEFSQPYWNDMYNQALSVNDKRYMVGGDISLTTTGWSSCMFFDLEQYGNIIGDVDEFYQFIDEGNWTLDALNEKCRQCYLDLNGNGLKDVADRYGMGIDGNNSSTDQYCFSSGVYYSTRGADGLPVLDMKNEKTLKFVEKFQKFVYNNEGVFPYGADNVDTADMTCVFEGGRMDDAVQKRDQEEDFGIIPMPKLDEKEEKYHSWISDNNVIYAMPITEDEDRVDMVCSVMEAMASETYRQVLPEYYERALKQKYARDSWSGKMLDHIHDGATTDFVAVYNLSLNGLGGLMRSVIGGNQPFISMYDSRAAVAEGKMKELFELFNAIKSPVDFVPETTETAAEGEIDFNPANDISSSWIALASKYKKSGTLAKPDLTEKFSFTVNGNDEIEVRSPDMKICGGYYPTAMIISRDTMPLADLSVTFHIDDGFVYEHAADVWSSSFSVLWTDKTVQELNHYLESPGTNGLREFVPDDTVGLCVSFMGTTETTGSNADLIYIILYDGTNARPEVDHRLGYRFYNQVVTDMTQPVTVDFKEDDTLGYVVSVNGNEYRTGKRGEETLDIDLGVLKDLEEGHLTIGGEANDAGFCNFTVSTINGKGAGTFFD